jgi:gamma-glutamyltranspeptidase/glutathione hydrolase
LTGHYRDYEVRTSGVGSGGGAFLPMLHALERFPLGEMEPLGVERMDLLAAVLGVVWPDRLAGVSLTEAGLIEAERLQGAAYADEVASRVRAGAGRGPRLAAVGPDGCTNHFSLADAGGNVVACTTTLQLLMGSTVTVPGTGILLNNAMGLFDPHPGAPNSVGPGKPTLTNMCPTIVLRGGKAVLSTGASGGRRIPSMIGQAVTLALDHGWSMDLALTAPRFHHEGSGRLILEDSLPADVQVGLRERGYTLDVRDWFSTDLGGQAPAVWYAGGEPYAVPDPRRHGGAAAC